MQTNFNNNQHFTANFSCYKGKFSHLAEGFKQATSNCPELRLHIDRTCANKTDKFHLLDKNGYVMSSATVDFSSLKLTETDAVKKLVDIFEILKIKHFTDTQIKKHIKNMYKDRDLLIKKLMTERNITRNNSLDNIIT